MSVGYTKAAKKNTHYSPKIRASSVGWGELEKRKSLEDVGGKDGRGLSLKEGTVRGGGDKRQELRDSLDKKLGFLFLCEVTDFTPHSANGAGAGNSIAMPACCEDTNQLLKEMNDLSLRPFQLLLANHFLPLMLPSAKSSFPISASFTAAARGVSRKHASILPLLSSTSL